MGIVNSVKSGITNPHPTGGGGLVKTAVSVVVVVGLVLVGLYVWGKVATKNIPVVSTAVGAARTYIS